MCYFVYDSNNQLVGFDYSYLDYDNYPNRVSSSYSYVKNLVGDIIGIVDNATGEQVVSYDYNTWGALLSSSGSLAEINPLRYRGYYYDSETSMYYLQSRYYDPSLKRFINADDAELIEPLTKSFIISGNLYCYCENNGIAKNDKNGHGATIKYNRDNAIKYACMYYDIFNDKYANYTNRGGDCTNFVSQCLKAGGFLMNNKWHFYYEYHSLLGINWVTENVTASWIRVESQYNYFKKSDFSNGVVYVTKNTKISSIYKKIKKGDIINFYSKEKNCYYHAAIVDGVSSKKITYSAHTVSRNKWDIMSFLKLSSTNKIRILRLKDNIRL